MKTIIKSFLFIALIAWAITGCQKDFNDPEVSLKSAASDCANVGSECAYAFKSEPWEEYETEDGIPGFIQNGTYNTSEGNTIVITEADAHHFCWISSFPICEVIVKAGNKGGIISGLYVYPGGYSGCVTHEDKAISHVTFCYGNAEMVIAAKATIYNPAWGNSFCISTGTNMFTTDWCGEWYLGINNYPPADKIGLRYPGGTTDIGEVTVDNGIVTVTLYGDLRLVQTYVYVGALGELLNTNLRGVCPNYSNTISTGWMKSDTYGTSVTFDVSLND